MACLAKILHVSHGWIATEESLNEASLLLHQVPHLGVVCALRRVIPDLDLRVHIPLTEASANALFIIGRVPERIQIVDRVQAPLSVHTCCHLLRRTDKYPNLSLVHIVEQALSGNVCLIVADDCDLVARYATLRKFGDDVSVGIELPAFANTKIREHHLCSWTMVNRLL